MGLQVHEIKHTQETRPDRECKNESKKYIYINKTSQQINIVPRKSKTRRLNAQSNQRHDGNKIDGDEENQTEVREVRYLM